MTQSNQKLKETKSKFVKVRCPKCKNEQIIFGKSASNIKCLVCENEIAESTGGKTKIKARILEILG
jgi:small subunit ribosomal protein S27e